MIRFNRFCRKSRRGGFTFMEILIALSVVAILFVPVMQLFSDALMGTGHAIDMGTATNLAMWQMERIRNLNFTREQFLADGGGFYPGLKESPIQLNGTLWRIKTEYIKATTPLEARVHVVRDVNREKPVITLVTLIEDAFWEEVIPI